MRFVHLLTTSIAAATAVAGLAVPAQGSAPDTTTWRAHATVRRDHPDVRVPVVVRTSGETVVDLDVAAPAPRRRAIGDAQIVIAGDNDRFPPSVLRCSFKLLHTSTWRG